MKIENAELLAKVEVRAKNRSEVLKVSAHKLPSFIENKDLISSISKRIK
jgi:hypothetical protein